MKIEVVYALPEDQTIVSLDVVADCTVLTAIQASNLLQRYPEIDLTTSTVGIFSQPVTLQTWVREGDRIEIYRPLLIDPKQARTARADRSRKKRSQ